MSYESDLQSACNDLLRKHNILFKHIEKGRNPKGQRFNRSDGFPDLAIWHKGKSFFVGLKEKGKKLQDNQKEWKRQSKKAGINYYVCFNIYQFKIVLEEEGIL